RLAGRGDNGSDRWCPPPSVLSPPRLFSVSSVFGLLSSPIPPHPPWAREKGVRDTGGQATKKAPCTARSFFCGAEVTAGKGREGADQPIAGQAGTGRRT